MVHIITESPARVLFGINCVYHSGCSQRVGLVGCARISIELLIPKTTRHVTEALIGALADDDVTDKFVPRKSHLFYLLHNHGTELYAELGTFHPIIRMSLEMFLQNCVDDFCDLFGVKNGSGVWFQFVGVLHRCHRFAHPNRLVLGARIRSRGISS